MRKVCRVKRTTGTTLKESKDIQALNMTRSNDILFTPDDAIRRVMDMHLPTYLPAAVPA